MLPNGYHASKPRPPLLKLNSTREETRGLEFRHPLPSQEGLFNPSGVLCAFLVKVVCGLVKRYL